MNWDWIKLEALGLLAIFLWLPPAVFRMPKLLQGVFLFGALPCAIATIPITKKLMLTSAIVNAEQAMESRLIQKAIALKTAQQERQLEAQYSNPEGV
jgi:hypothetical protein